MTTFCNYFAKFGLAIAFLAMLPAVALLWPGWREWIPGLSQASQEPQAKLTIQGPANSSTIASLAPPTESRQRLIVARREPVYRQGSQESKTQIAASLPRRSPMPVFQPAAPIDLGKSSENDLRESGPALPAVPTLEPSESSPTQLPDQPAMSQQEIEQSLRKLGASYYRLEVWEDAVGAMYQFQCEIPPVADHESPRKFSSQARDGISAMQQVLHDLEAWRKASWQ